MAVQEMWQVSVANDSPQPLSGLLLNALVARLLSDPLDALHNAETHIGGSSHAVPLASLELSAPGDAQRHRWQSHTTQPGAYTLAWVWVQQLRQRSGRWTW